MMIFVASVLPDPLSPLIMMDWFDAFDFLALTSCLVSLSASRCPFTCVQAAEQHLTSCWISSRQFRYIEIQQYRHSDFRSIKLSKAFFCSSLHPLASPCFLYVDTERKLKLIKYRGRIEQFFSLSIPYRTRFHNIRHRPGSQRRKLRRRLIATSSATTRMKTITGDHS